MNLIWCSYMKCYFINYMNQLITFRWWINNFAHNFMKFFPFLEWKRRRSKKYKYEIINIITEFKQINFSSIFKQSNFHKLIQTIQFLKNKIPILILFILFKKRHHIIQTLQKMSITAKCINSKLFSHNLFQYTALLLCNR